MHEPALVLQPQSLWAYYPAHANELQAKLSVSHTYLSDARAPA